MFIFLFNCSDKDDKLDGLNPTTHSASASVLPSASLVTSVSIDECSESDGEIKLAKVNIFKQSLLKQRIIKQQQQQNSLLFFVKSLFRHKYKPILDLIMHHIKCFLFKTKYFFNVYIFSV